MSHRSAPLGLREQFRDPFDLGLEHRSVSRLGRRAPGRAEPFAWKRGVEKGTFLIYAVIYADWED